MNKIQLHLIPVPLFTGAIDTLCVEVLTLIPTLRNWIVEDIRTARRFLRKVDPAFPIDDCEFGLLNEQDSSGLAKARQWFQEGKQVGLVSEAGCPAVADPGSQLVQLAHSSHIGIKPYAGPNSIILAIMASGFNGQCFQFHGYLPNKQPALSQKIKIIETESKQKGISQFFIETPYRNASLFQELINTCQSETLLSVAYAINHPEEQFFSCSIAQWKKKPFDFQKNPAVFGLYAGSQ